MRRKLQKQAPWIPMVIGFTIVALLGIVDYRTGDYSLLIFYAIPVALEAWCVGRSGAIAIGVASGAARFASDFMSYMGPSFKYWNSLQDMIFLLMLGLLISTMRDLVNDDDRKMNE